jgi:hypothetical protein
MFDPRMRKWVAAASASGLAKQRISANDRAGLGHRPVGIFAVHIVAPRHRAAVSLGALSCFDGLSRKPDAASRTVLRIVGLKNGASPDCHNLNQILNVRD